MSGAPARAPRSIGPDEPRRANTGNIDIFVWLPMAIFGGEKRSLVTVDEFGGVSVQKV